MRRRTAFLIPVFSVACLCATPETSLAYRLPDTDQRKCYQEVTPYAEIPCAGTGQDGAYVQNPLSYTENGSTVTDNNTGLVWQKEDDGTTYNWYWASGTYDSSYNSGGENVCGSLSLGGYSDWRLPSKKELMSIVSFGYGDVNYGTKVSAYYVRCVRGGQ